MKKLPPEEIISAKRYMGYLAQDLKKIRKHLDIAAANIRIAIIAKTRAIEAGDKPMIKYADMQRIQFLEQQELLIDLQCSKHTEYHELAQSIRDIRNKQIPVPKVVRPSDIAKVPKEITVLIRLRREQKLLKQGVADFTRMIEQFKAGKPIITYRGKKYPIENFPFTLEQMETRLNNYKHVQRVQGVRIINLRDTGYRLHGNYFKLKYYQIIELIKQSNI